MNRRNFLKILGAAGVVSFVAGLAGFAVADVVDMAIESSQSSQPEIPGQCYLELDTETGGIIWVHEYSCTKLSPSVFHGLGTFQELRDPAPQPPRSYGWLYSNFAVEREDGKYQARQVWSLVKRQ